MVNKKLFWKTLYKLKKQNIKIRIINVYELYNINI